MDNKKQLARYRFFTIFSLMFLLGIIATSFIEISFTQSYLILILTVLGLLFSVFVNYILKNYYLWVASFGVAFLVLGVIYYSFYDYRNRVDLPFDAEVTISGKIVRKPETDISKQKVILEIEKIDQNDEKITFNKNNLIQASLPHFPRVKYGDKIEFEGKIQKPVKIEDFDQGNYLKKFRVFGVVSQVKDTRELDSRLTTKEKLYKILFTFSDRFEENINKVMPEPQASLATGLILGVKRNIPDDIISDLNITSTTHIIALSGFNVTIIVIVITDILIRFLRRRQVFIIGTLLVAGFVVLTGASSSIVRAAIFSILIIFGKTVGRRGDFTNLMLLAALILILFNPYLLRYDLGFELSFAAFCGLVYLSPIVRRIFEKTIFIKMPKWAFDAFIETGSAQIAVFPLIMTAFGRISLIGPVANIFVLWIIPLSMAMSFLTGLSTFFSYFLGKLTALLAWPTLEYILKIIGFFARIPGASLEIGRGLWIIEIALYLLLVSATVLLYRKYKIRLN